MYVTAYIHTVDENTVIEIYGKTWKFCKKYVCSVADKAGFYNRSHATSEHRVRAPEAYPSQSQSYDTPTLEINFS